MSYRRIRVMLVFVVVATTMSAQFNIGFQGSYLNTFNSSNDGQVGFGLRGEMAANEIFVGQAGFNYYFPGKYSHTLQANAYSSNATPQTIPVVGISTLTITDYYIGVKYYIRGTHSTFKKVSGTGVYFAGDIGVLWGGFETKGIDTDSINWNLYSVPLKDTQLGAFTFLSFNPSFGAERRLNDRIYAYTELKMFFKLYETSSNGAVEFDIPYAFNFNLGLRIPLGSEY